MTFFYKLLYFLGIRKFGDDSYAKDNKKSFYNIVKRKILQQRNELEIYSQPRQITRLLFEREIGQDLSPQPRCRRVPSDINIQPPILAVRDTNQSVLELLCTIIGDWIYSCIIFLILCIHPTYTFIRIVQTQTINEFPYYSSFFYQMIPPFHYYYAIRYFSTDHFERFYYQNSLSYLLNRLSMLAVLCASANVGINIWRLLGTDFDGEFPFYNEFGKIPQIFIFIFLMISWIYGNLIVFLNLIIFCLIFCKHRQIIVEISNRIHKECSDSNNNSLSLSLNEIMQELSLIVFHLKESIGHFQNIFSSFTFFGALSFGFFVQRIKDGNFASFPWNTFIIYIILQTIFFIMILNVSQHKNKMTDFIKNPIYIKKYIKRYTIRDIEQHFSEDNDKFIITNLIEENASLLDFMALNQLFNDDWTEFKFFGFNIARFELIKKGIVIVGLIVGLNEILN